MHGYTVVREDGHELGVSYSCWAMEEDIDSVYDKKYVETIGNIYENKELL